MNKQECEICKKDLDQECFAEIAITIWRPAGMSFAGEIKTFKICNRGSCSVELFSALKEKAEKKLNKNKTNAVGPLPKGAPGCIFNE